MRGYTSKQALNASTNFSYFFITFNLFNVNTTSVTDTELLNK